MSLTGHVDVGQPNSTLYVQNLNERIALKYLIPQLKSMFSEHGEVIEVIAKKRLTLRGQAFIIYRDVDTARKSLENLQGERIYGKSMIIKFAKYKSDSISKVDGTYEIERRRREQDRIERARTPRITRRQLLAQMAASPALQTMPMLPGFGIPTTSPAMAPQMIGSELQLPNKVLYLQQVPSGTKEAQLHDVFKKFPGFVEVRSVPNRPDVAFVEYENEMQATVVRQATDGMEIQPESKIRVTFARR